MSKSKMLLLYLLLCICSVITSSFLYFVGKEWIIIRWPSYITEPLNDDIHQEAIKKKVRLSFWQHARWNHETIDIAWSQNTSQAMQYIIRSLLTLLEEEQVLEKKISLQSVAPSSSGNDVYISFDRKPFNEEAPMFEKLMIIESIVKTMRENGISTPNIYFLVHHQSIKDLHLDFSHPWPLEGFL